ncbi:MAG TPA: hypothetical protein VGU24_18500 [Microvirga sp.]|jgi:hypothetical protein|nr:hypothetical protein [Microvirga sp.]
MSDEQEEKPKPAEIGPLVTRIVSGIVAAVALGGAGYLALAGLELATAATTPTFIRDHAPAILGVPVLAALAAAIVCGARALEDRSHIELLGLRAEGAGAIVTGWTVVFAALAVALRALW